MGIGVGVDELDWTRLPGQRPAWQRGHRLTQLHQTRTLPPVPYREQQPTFIPPMLLASRTVPNSERWALEVKWDGCRAQVRYDTHSVTVRSRNGRECSADFPELVSIAEALGKHRVTLDGELVCLRDDGRPDFAPLRRRLTGSVRNRHPVVFQIFDVLHLDGRSTRSLPYRERRALLTELALDGPAWRTPASMVVDRAQDFVARVEELGLEGVVAKRLDSRYLPGRRSTAWVKHKLRREERFAVTGIRRSVQGVPEALFVARPDADGSFTGAGAIELGTADGIGPRARTAPVRARRPASRRRDLVSRRGVRGRFGPRAAGWRWCATGSCEASSPGDHPARTASLSGYAVTALRVGSCCR